MGPDEHMKTDQESSIVRAPLLRSGSDARSASRSVRDARGHHTGAALTRVLAWRFSALPLSPLTSICISLPRGSIRTKCLHARPLARPHPFAAPGVVPGGGGERENRSSKLRSPSAGRAPAAAAASLPDGAPPPWPPPVPPYATSSTLPGEAPVAPTPRGGECGVTPSRGDRLPELFRRPPPLWPLRKDCGDDLPLLGLCGAPPTVPPPITQNASEP